MTYSYDVFGRLTTATDNTSVFVGYAYNGLGQRVQKTVKSNVGCGGGGGNPMRAGGATGTTMKGTTTNGTTTKGSGATGSVAPPCNPWLVRSTMRYVYDDQGHLIGEYDSTGGESQETVWFDGQPVATVQNGVIYYIYADNLGTPRSIVRASDNLEVWRWDSDPFGTTAPTSPNAAVLTLFYDLRFAGQVADQETGLFYNGMRDYNPRTGRYLEPDPIGLEGGLSRYSYVGGNPLSYTDPKGLMGGGGYSAAHPTTPSGPSFWSPEWWRQASAPYDTRNCTTSECAAGLLPAPSDNRTQSQIDVGQCTLICNIAAAAPVAACNAAAGGGIVGGLASTAGRVSVCSLVCKP